MLGLYVLAALRTLSALASPYELKDGEGLVANLLKDFAGNALSTRDPATGNIPYTLRTGRTFLLNVPADYVHGKEHPLISRFHGVRGSSEKQQKVTELSDPSLRIAWKPFLNTGAPYENTIVDNIAYVHDTINTICSTYTNDHTRLYASGKFNSGGFASLLVCRPDTSALFAAYVPTGRGVPVPHIHGVEDTVAPFYGRTPDAGGHGPVPDASGLVNGIDPDVK
nr:hypothetical protein L203_06149 [Cryptococcus depauperatus CBS 7841]